ALSLFAPVAFAFTAVAAACERQTPMAIDRVQGCALALNALVAVTLNIAYSRLLKVASPVTFTVFGTAKDVTTAGLSLDMVGGTITPLQLCGYATTLFGMVYYDRVKQLQ
ncbi:Putative sugar phosphate/phosphate translocator, partial [Durusdinium trenchii]